MAGEAGQVWIKTLIDNEQAKRDLKRFERYIERYGKEIAEQTAIKIPIQKEMERLGVALDAAKAKLHDMTRVGASPALVTKQAEAVQELQAKWDAAATQVERCDANIQRAQFGLNRATKRAGQLTAQMTGAGEKTERFAEATEAAQQRMQLLRKRIAGVVRSALVFTVITQALAKLRNLIADNIKADDELSAALSRMRAAWLTAFQPVWEVIQPALLMLIRTLTAVANAISRVFSFFTGKSTKQMADNAEALDNERKALDGVGGAAKDATASLAGFDEINQLNDSSGGGGGGGSDFASGWGGEVDPLGLKEKLLALGTAATAAWLAFGNLGAGIALVVGSGALLVDAIKDIAENGLTMENMLQTVAGLLGAGLGIGILTGNWIPLLIAGIASALLALAYFTGNGEELIGGLKDVFSGLKDFVAGVFTGDWKRAMEGINKITQGLSRVVGAVVDSIEDGINGFLDWLDQKTDGKLSVIIEDIKLLVSSAFDGLKYILQEWISFLGNVFTGQWQAAWQNLVNIFNRIFGPVIQLIQNAINKMKEIRDFRLSGITGVSDYYQDKYAPSSYAAVREVPALASGAVIPPNQKFLAMLGDQKSGTNIETPLETMVQAFRQALNEGNSGGAPIHVTLQVDKTKLGTVVIDAINTKTQSAGKTLLLI